jgi:hypothetical protein
MGEWERLAPSWWAYRLRGRERPYGYVMRQGQDGLTGVVGLADALWTAIVLGWERSTDETVAERASLDEARAALEQHAARPGGRAQGTDA